MKIQEIITETTVSGAIATVAQPLGEPIKRMPVDATAHKYEHEPKTGKKRKKHAG